MPAPVDSQQLIRDGLIGLSLVIGLDVSWAIVSGSMKLSAGVGMIVLTAAGAVAAYRHGQQFGDVELP